MEPEIIELGTTVIYICGSDRIAATVTGRATYLRTEDRYQLEWIDTTRRPVNVWASRNEIALSS